jgi:hypothetical protein
VAQQHNDKVSLPSPSAATGGVPTQSPNIRVLAAATAHHDCGLAMVALSQRVDLERMCEKTQFKVPFGQDPQAFLRGEMFERRVKQHGYAELIRLLREEAGLPLERPRIANLRAQAPRNSEGMKIRFTLTKRLLKQIAEKHPEAPNIIDGAVLAVSIRGRLAYFEADGLAAAEGGQIHVAEVKSFPLTDGRCDSAKLGPAIDQAAWYGLLCEAALKELGFSGKEVSPECFIILPRNVGLVPTLVRKNFSARVARARTMLTTAQQAGLDLASGEPLQFPSPDDPEVILKLLDLVDKVGTRYRGECLSDCGMSRLCRSRCHELSLPALCGPQVEQQMAGIITLRRAHELIGKAQPSSTEAHAASMLKMAARLYDRAVGGAR